MEILQSTVLKTHNHGSSFTKEKLYFQNFYVKLLQETNLSIGSHTVQIFLDQMLHLRVLKKKL